MQKILFLLLASMGLLSACSEDNNTISEYENWPARNITAFRDTLAQANAAIATARTAYGDAWADHCEWRTLGSYASLPTAKTSWRDSIAVRVLKSGTGSGPPLYTDTVRVVYVGRLLPTAQTPKGYVFDQSGLSGNVDEAFLPQYANTARFAVSNLVEGFTTALQQMHIGDRWRLFLPADMAYGNTSRTGIPAGSMLIFDVELHNYWRRGTTVR